MTQTSGNDSLNTLIPEEWTMKSEEYQPVVECVPAEMPLVVPVTGESFCQCPTQSDLSEGDTHIHECTCGEEDPGCEWVWDEGFKSSSALLNSSNRKVSFHPDYSCGTAAMRGSTELRHGQHYWEIKMTSPVYGTDMMVGIGTAEVNLDQCRHSFSSLLGSDAHSWGLSYTGLLHHKGSKVNFSPRFGQGSIIGLHLDTWHGTLTFYKNHRCIGVAARGLQNKSFYPMVSSTAAKSSMKLIRSCSAPTSLQYLCCWRLHELLPDCADALTALPLPPGLRLQLIQQLGWVLQLGRPRKPSTTTTNTNLRNNDDNNKPADPTPYPIPNYGPYLDSTHILEDAACEGAAPCPDLLSNADVASYATPAHLPDPVPCSSPDYHPHLDPTSLPDPSPLQKPLPLSSRDYQPYLESTFILEGAADQSPAPYPDLVPYSDLASATHLAPDLNSEADSDSDPTLCPDAALCPCCDAPLSFTACERDDDDDACRSSFSYCSCPASRPASPLPDYSHGPATPPPDSAHCRPGSASGSDSDSCSSGSCQRKRCRWT